MLSSLLVNVDPYLESLRTFWSQRELRERRALTILGVVVLIFLAYVLILAPMMAHLNALRLQVKDDEKTLVFMQGVDKALAVSQANTARVRATVADVQGLIQASSLAPGLQSLKQMNDVTIRASFQGVPFDDLIAVLGKVASQFCLTIHALSVTSTDYSQGQVDAELELDALRDCHR